MNYSNKSTTTTTTTMAQCKCANWTETGANPQNTPPLQPHPLPPLPPLPLPRKIQPHPPRRRRRRPPPSRRNLSIWHKILKGPRALPSKRRTMPFPCRWLHGWNIVVGKQYCLFLAGVLISFLTKAKERKRVERTSFKIDWVDRRIRQWKVGQCKVGRLKIFHL